MQFIPLIAGALVAAVGIGDGIHQMLHGNKNRRLPVWSNVQCVQSAASTAAQTSCSTPVPGRVWGTPVSEVFKSVYAFIISDLKFTFLGQSV